MSFSYVISLTFLILLLVSIILYTFLRKKNVVDEAPGAIAAVLLILLIFFSPKFHYCPSNCYALSSLIGSEFSFR